MNYCNKCGGTGTAMNNKFCTCTDGRFKKMQQEAKLKGEMKRAEENREKEKKRAKSNAAKSEQLELINDGPIKKKNRAPLSYYEVGQWIELRGNQYHGRGSVGFILEYDKKDNTYNILFTKFGKEGLPIKQTRWIDEEDLKPLERANNKQDIHTLIDLAIDLNDEVWFKRLANKL